MFRSSRPDFIETLPRFTFLAAAAELFRSSRPDFIETCAGFLISCMTHYCSGLPGRTSLRHNLCFPGCGRFVGLFRSSRPDFIETPKASSRERTSGFNCSGLPGRTSLRPLTRLIEALVEPNCSGLPGRTSLRRIAVGRGDLNRVLLFRSSRPDFIETYP